MHLRLRILSEIARTTASGLLNQSFTWILIAIGTILILFSGYLFPFILGENFKAAMDIGTSTLFLLGSLVSIWNAVSAISTDLERKTIWTLLTKPISRTDYLIAKATGILLVTAFCYCIWVPCLMVITRIEHLYELRIYYTGKQAGWGFLAALTLSLATITIIQLRVQTRVFPEKSTGFRLAIGLWRALQSPWNWLLFGVFWLVIYRWFGGYDLAARNPDRMLAHYKIILDHGYEWRILPGAVALLQLHLIAILTGILAALLWSLPTALLVSFLTGFALELLPALWMPFMGTWMPLPAGEAYRYNESLTLTKVLDPPMTDMLVMLFAQSLPLLAFLAAFLCFARYFLARMDWAS